MNRERVVVTGGAGFIGSHIVDELVLQGYDVAVVDDLSSGRPQNLHPNARFYKVDICDRERLTAVFAEVQPQFVFHEAAQISVAVSVREPVRDAEVNIMGFLHLLELSAAHGVKRVVFASSGGTLYGDVAAPAVEEAPLRPVSPYGLSKLTGERYLEFYARQHGVGGVALRYGNVYGPRQDPHGEAGVVAIFTRRMLAHQSATIFGDGKNLRDYVYVADVARANVLALTAPMAEPFTAINIGTGRGADVNMLEAALRRCCEQYAEGIPATRYGVARAGDLRSSLLNPALAARLLGWEPQVGLEEGLAATVRWFAEHDGDRA